MWPYFLFFTTLAVLAVFPRAKPGQSAGAQQENALWAAAWLALVLFVGLRHEVGGDRSHYLKYLERVQFTPLLEVLALPDPGFYLVNWICDRLGWDILGVNLFSAIVLASGVIIFARGLSRPWLALVVAVPYLVIVVGMGYVRQGMALALTMIGLRALSGGSTVRFVVWVLIGATFHKTAILLLPIAILANTRNRYWTAVWVAAVCGLAYVLMLEDAVEGLYENYIEAEYQSEGALVRLLMNALPAALYLLFRRRFSFGRGEASLWRWFSIISLALLAVLLVSPSTTAVDRIALYMIPLQLVVFSELPTLLGSRRSGNQGWVTAVVGYYLVVQLVWFNFATHSSYWVPYQVYPLAVAL